MFRVLDTPRRRSLAGFVAALAFVPLMLGVTACLKTPIGDPERGWVDPRVTGVWIVALADASDVDYDAQLWLFEPYDSRTWLVTVVTFEDSLEDVSADSQPATAPAADADPDSEMPAAIQKTEREPIQPPDVRRMIGKLGEDRVKVSERWVFKAWLTSIAERRFLILEPKSGIDPERGFDPELWFVHRIVLKGERMELAMVNTGSGQLGSATTRGEAEQIIARNAADPDLYEDAGILYRVPREAYGDLSDALDRADLNKY